MRCKTVPVAARGSFTRAGLTFDLDVAGPPQGEPVVLLHGFPQSARCWEQVAPRLHAAGCRTLAPDQRGYSPRARPGGLRAYRVTELVADLLALLDSQGLPRAHVVGHDWGAAVAWATAASHPGRVATVTGLSVPPAAAFLRALLTSRQAFASWYMYAFQVPVLPELVLGRPGRLAFFLERTGQSRQRALRDAADLSDPAALRAALAWYRALPLARPVARGALIEVPALFVWSDGDTAITRAAAQRADSAVQASYRFVELAGVSHWLPEEAPGPIADLIAGHVSAHPIVTSVA